MNVKGIHSFYQNVLKESSVSDLQNKYAKIYGSPSRFPEALKQAFATLRSMKNPADVDLDAFEDDPDGFVSAVRAANGQPTAEELSQLVLDYATLPDKRSGESVAKLIGALKSLSGVLSEEELTETVRTLVGNCSVGGESVGRVLDVMKEEGYVADPLASVTALLENNCEETIKFYLDLGVKAQNLFCYFVACGCEGALARNDFAFLHNAESRVKAAALKGLNTLAKLGESVNLRTPLTFESDDATGVIAQSYFEETDVNAVEEATDPDVAKVLVDKFGASVEDIRDIESFVAETALNGFLRDKSVDKALEQMVKVYPDIKGKKLSVPLPRTLMRTLVTLRLESLKKLVSFGFRCSERAAESAAENYALIEKWWNGEKTPDGVITDSNCEEYLKTLISLGFDSVIKQKPTLLIKLLSRLYHGATLNEKRVSFLDILNYETPVDARQETYHHTTSGVVEAGFYSQGNVESLYRLLKTALRYDALNKQKALETVVTSVIRKGLKNLRVSLKELVDAALETEGSFGEEEKQAVADFIRWQLNEGAGKYTLSEKERNSVVKTLADVGVRI